MAVGTIEARLHERSFYADDPYPVLARLREEAPVFWYEPGRFWAITRHEDAHRVHGDPETFSCQYGIAMFDNFNVEGRLRAAGLGDATGSRTSCAGCSRTTTRARTP